MPDQIMKNSIAILLFILSFYGICQQNVDLKDNTIKIQDDLKGILDDSVDQIFIQPHKKHCCLFLKILIIIFLRV